MTATQALDLLNCPLDRRVLIEASAGTGKTWTLSTLVLRLLLEKELSLDQILIVTFTEAATAELRSRIRARIKEALMLCRDSGAAAPDPVLSALVTRAGAQAQARLETALGSLDKARISTIHGFCQNVLEGWPLLCGGSFSPELLEDQSALISEAVADFWRARLYPAPETLQRLLIQAEELGPESLREVLVSCLGLPAEAFKILPELVADPDPSEPTQDVWPELLASYTQLQQSWGDGLEIERLMTDALAKKSLNGQKYRLDWLPKLLRESSRFLAGPYLALPVPQAIFKLSAGQLTAAAKAEPLDHDFFRACDKFWTIWQSLADGSRQARLNLCRELLTEVPDRLRARKQAAGQCGFDDLLLNVHAALRGELGAYLAEALRQRFRAALIDEFQDTDRIQNEIFASIYPENTPQPLFLIGDPKQSIYRFRGADIFAYFKTTRAPDLARYSLLRNFRSRPGVLAGVASLFARADAFQAGQASLPVIAYDPVSAALPASEQGPAFVLWHDESQTLSAGQAHRRVAEATATEIARLLAQGRKASEIAVLTRSNRQARQMATTLSRLNIPSVVYANDPVFASREAWELEQVLAAIQRPDEPGLRRALTTQLWGETAGGLLNLQADVLRWEAMLASFGGYLHFWREQGFARLWLRLERERPLMQNLAASADGERRLANLRQLLTLLLEQEQQPGMTPAGLLNWFKLARRQPENSERTAQQLETEREAVRLLTVHRSKGLEFEIVFCPWLWNEAEDNGLVSCFDPDSDARLIWIEPLTGSDRKDNPFARRQRMELQAESIRLAYVAMTRAKERCYVAWIWQKDAPTAKVNRCAWSALGFLLGLSGESLSEEAVTDKLKNFDLTLAPLPAPSTVALDRSLSQSGQSQDLRAVQAKTFSRQLPASWRMSSFSSLKPARDPLMLPERREDGTLPGGSTVGSFLHYLLEHVDFKASRKQISQMVRRHLPGCPELQGFEHVVETLIELALNTPLDTDLPGLSLSSLKAFRREEAFYFPLQSQPLTGIEALIKDYLPEDTGWEDSRLSAGLLHGRLDLLFEWQERWYVLDYKSTYLGAGPEAYTPAKLEADLRENGQLLQGLLYLAALHRHLQARLPGYQPEQQLGGVYFQFLRGLDLNSEQSGNGVYCLRPPAELIDALSRKLGGGHD